MYCSDETGGIVIDVGSSTIKLGYAGEDVPRLVYPSAYGYINQDQPQYFIGSQELNTRRDQMEISPSYSNSKISNYEALAKLIDSGISSGLRYKASEHPLLIVEDPYQPSEQRLKLAEQLFETLNVPAIYFLKSSSCIGFSLGKTSCLSVDFGASGVRVIPVYDGYSLMNSGVVSAYGGDYLTSLLRSKLSSQKINITPNCFLKKQVVEGVVANIQKIEYPNTRNIVSDMKECCFRLHSRPVVTNPPPSTPISYTLPDNQEVHLDQDAYFIPEVMMTGTTAGDGQSLPDTMYQCLLNCNVEIRKELTSNIILAGGGARMTGLSERLDYEMGQRLNSTFKPKLFTSEPLYSPYNAWTGGSIIASLGSFQQLWVSKEEYMENKDVIRSRCH